MEAKFKKKLLNHFRGLVFFTDLLSEKKIHNSHQKNWYPIRINYRLG